MGLFRRGTKLLRLGNGLRDCCCRPEKPPVCFCPSMCRYYWEWGGHSAASAQDVSHGCDLSADETTESLASYGVVSTPVAGLGKLAARQATVYVPQYASYVGGTSFTFEHIVVGETTYTDIAEAVGIITNAPQAKQRTLVIVEAVPACFYGGSSNTIQWNLFFTVLQTVEFGTGFNSDQRVTVYRRYVYTNATVPGRCVESSLLQCENESPGEPRLHLASDVSISFGADGVTVGEVSHSWETVDSFNVDLGYTEWHVGDEYPLTSASVSLRMLSSCLSQPCDCTQSLDGMIITFEGQEFTYGQLDSFFNAGTWWEETSAGVFRRRDTESCDGSLNQTVKQATIECTQIDGVDTWVCYLDHTCEERDDLTCPGPPDAGRNKQWTGVFECDENGKPTGSPGSLEVDSDTTTGTPAAECVDALTVPSISISAPP